MCGCVSQNLQEAWTTPIVATLVERVNDKDESICWVARKVTDEVKEERVLHRLRRQISVFSKTVCHHASKRGEDSGECINECRDDICELAQMRVIPPAEEGSSKMLSIVKIFTDRMS
jgi:hypothetical protein